MRERGASSMASVAAISKLSGWRSRALSQAHVVVMDVPPIFPQMGGDPVCARLNGKESGADRIRHGPAACVAHSRHVIDVAPRTERTHLFTPRLSRR